MPIVTAVDPAGVVCVRQPDDYRKLLKVTHTYGPCLANGYALQPVLPGFGHLMGQPSIGQVVEEWTADTLEVWRDGSLEVSIPNPYGFIPYVIFPNLRVPKEPWGQSDLIDIMAINRDLNARLSVLSHILEVSGNPIAVL